MTQNGNEHQDNDVPGGDASGQNTVDPVVAQRVTERLVRRTCARCGTWITYAGRGRPPLYCSSSCRTRAWEVRTALERLEAEIAGGQWRTGPVREVIERHVETVRERVVVRTVKADPPPPSPSASSTAGASSEPRPPMSDEALRSAMTALIVAGDVLPVPAHARQWASVLDRLARALEEPGLVRDRHWDHRHIHQALTRVVGALARAHPGGLDALEGRR